MKTLENDEIYDLILKYRETGNNSFLDTIFFSVKDLITSYIIGITKQYRLSSINITEDLQQQAYLVFLFSIKGYDLEYITKTGKKTKQKFSSYLYFQLQVHLIKYIAKLLNTTPDILKNQTKVYWQLRKDLEELENSNEENTEKIIQTETLIKKNSLRDVNFSTSDETEEDENGGYGNFLNILSNEQEAKTYDGFENLIKKVNVQLSKQELEFLYNLYFIKDSLQTYSDEEIEIYSRNIKNRIEKEELERKRLRRNSRIKIKKTK